MTKTAMSKGAQYVPKIPVIRNEQLNEEVPFRLLQQFLFSRVPRSLKEQKQKQKQNWQTKTMSPTALPTAEASRETNWQALQPTVRARNAIMFNNPLMADVQFLVGINSNLQQIPSHKYILATGSSVFFAMFFGALADEKDNREIKIPDVEPAAFLNLLRYLYCDEIQLEADNVLNTLYAAKKYLVPHLAKACVQFLETSLSAKNACMLLSQGRFFEEEQLMQRCWEVIDTQAEEALKSDSFCDIDYSTLKSVLARDTLNAKELSLFNAACCWAEAECVRKELECTAANKRKALKDAVYLIRIPALTLEEYANGPAQSGILSLEEITHIFLHFTAVNKPKLPFITHNRTGLKPQKCRRFQSSAYRCNQWRYRGRCDSIQFSVDKRIFIVGFGLYGSSNGSAEYQAKIELKKNGDVLGENTKSFHSDGSSSTFSVMFDKLIPVEPDTFYTACATLGGTELSYFGQEGMAEIQCGKVNFQFQCSCESTNGTGVQGGQIPEIIFYC